MFLRRIFCMVLAALFIIGLAGAPVSATGAEITTSSITKGNFVLPRATESFSINIPAKTQLSANTSFPMAAGETVTIKASYSPFSASVDFGLVAPNGVYYYFTITDGNIDKTIEVPDSGEYILRIRNNSGVEVKAVGFVKY